MSSEDSFHGSGVSRRAVACALISGMTALALPIAGCRRAGARLNQQFAELEGEVGGRLGVAIIDRTGATVASHRGDERFAMCSTFKLPLAAVILREVAAGRLRLDQPVAFGEQDLVPYAPVVERHLEQGQLTVAELAEAAQTTSDNVAANLLLRLIGGPRGFTERLRALGDRTTRLDRFEPEMNLVVPGDPRDTTSPVAMAALVHGLFDGTTLSAAHATTLAGWMVATRTGRRRLRAGLPADWRVGDKTGSGIASAMPNQTNDVAVVWQGDAQRPTLVVTAYYAANGHYPGIRAQDEAVLAEVGRRVADASGED